MIETRSSVAELLERLEEAKRILDNPDRIDDMILKLSRLEKFLSKFGTIKELAEHLHFIEHKMYMVKEFLTTDEAADFLRISKSLLYKLTRTREIPIYKPNGKNIYIHRDDLNRWIRQNKVLSEEELEEAAITRLNNLRSKNKR